MGPSINTVCCRPPPGSNITCFSHLVLQQPVRSDDFVKDVFADVRVDGGQWVVQQVDVSVCVHGSGQTDPLFLTTTQVDALKG